MTRSSRRRCALLGLLLTLVTLLTGCSLIPGLSKSAAGSGGAADSSDDPGVLWREDFTGAAAGPLDATHWNYQLGAGGWGDGEVQTFTAAPTNVARTGSGSLRIQAVKGAGNTFTSAEVTTRGKVDLDEGTLQVRMKAPVGRGLMTTFSLLAASTPDVHKPSAGAIDVALITTDPNKVYTGLRGPRTTGAQQWRIGTFFNQAEPVDEDFHTYTVQKTSGQLGFGIDGHVTAIVKASDLPAGDRWVFDQPFYLVLGVAVGGSIVGPPDASTVFPAVLTVDWVSLSKTVIS